MAAQKLKTEVRQEQILREVLQLIATHGAKSLSMASVARRVGVVPSALYRHYRSKDEILDAAIAAFERMVHQNLRRVMEESPDALERLRLLLIRQVRMIREDRVLAIPRIVFSEDLYVSRPQRKAKVYTLVRGILDRLGDLIRQGQRQGRIRRDLDVPAAARMFLAMLQSAAILWFISDGQFDIARNAHQTWMIFVQAISMPVCKVGK